MLSFSTTHLRYSACIAPSSRAFRTQQLSVRLLHAVFTQTTVSDRDPMAAIIQRLLLEPPFTQLHRHRCDDAAMRVGRSTCSITADHTRLSRDDDDVMKKRALSSGFVRNVSQANPPKSCDLTF